MRWSPRSPATYEPVGGPEARALDDLAPDVRRDRLLARLAGLLGPEVTEPADWHDKSWHLDPDAGGGYLALPLLGADAADVPMDATPVGRVHWGGSETATDHPGYLDGAIEAGERVAAEVAAALGATGSTGATGGDRTRS